MTLPTYATREQMQVATDTHTTAQMAARIDRALQGASRRIDETFHRHFYPLTEAVTYNGPRVSSLSTTQGAGFWLDRDLISITSATEDGTNVTDTIELFPAEFGPPYAWVGLTGSEVVITGVWGYSSQTVPAGALAEELDTSETAVDVTDSSLVGVGDLLICASEKMVVTGKTLLDTGGELATTDLTADASAQTVTMDDGSLVNAGEIITLDSERMLVVSISADTLTVERAYDGSTLAAHDATGTPATVYAPRTLTVERAAAGSTAASHSTATALTRNLPPFDITNLCLAEAIVTMQQESAGYARTIGTGEGEREAAGRGLADARKMSQIYRRRRLAHV